MYTKVEFTSTYTGETYVFDLIYKTEAGHSVLGQPHPSKPGLIGIFESYSGQSPKMVRGSFKTIDNENVLHVEFICNTGLRKEDFKAAQAVVKYVHSFDDVPK